MELNEKDPIIFCINAIEDARDKELALIQAKKAKEHWWAITWAKKNLAEEEQNSLFDRRAVALSVVATVYVWDEEYDLAKKLEDSFLYNKTFWVENYKQIIDAYLMMLIIQKQINHLNKIFENLDFRNYFISYQDVYLSYLNPNYEFKGKSDLFSLTINIINNYNRKLYGTNFI